MIQKIPFNKAIRRRRRRGTDLRILDISYGRDYKIIVLSCLAYFDNDFATSFWKVIFRQRT